MLAGVMNGAESADLSRWRTIHAIVSLAILADVALYRGYTLAGPLLVVWGFGGFCTLSRLHHARPRRRADVLSSLRLLTALSVTATLFLYDRYVTATVVPGGSLQAAGGWIYVVFALLAAAELTDFLDGRLARAEGVTEFGGIWDEEIDGYFVLLLSVSAHLYFGLGRWILAAGALRYLYLLSLHLLPEAPARPVAMTVFAKSACAAMVAGLIATTLPPLPREPVLAANAAAFGLLLVSFSWSWQRNLSSWSASAGRGVVRSFALYFGVPFRTRRRAAFYRQFLAPGGLGFDIGAHLGDRIRAWRRLGVRAVAVEPQPRFAALLRRFHPPDTGVSVVEAAVGAHSGTAELSISDAHPTVSSVSPDWISQVRRTSGFARVHWNRAVTVRMLTLDELVERFGAPQFIKIDVEGHEEAVLSGLSRPVPALSFEYLPAAPDRAVRCVELLRGLGDYRFNAVVAESTRFLLEAWADPEVITSLLLHRWPYEKCGDVYARLKE